MSPSRAMGARSGSISRGPARSPSTGGPSGGATGAHSSLDREASPRGRAHEAGPPSGIIGSAKGYRSPSASRQ
jgi:hypothetical protein